MTYIHMEREARDTCFPAMRYVPPDGCHSKVCGDVCHLALLIEHRAGEVCEWHHATQIK